MSSKLWYIRDDRDASKVEASFCASPTVPSDCRKGIHLLNTHGFRPLSFIACRTDLNRYTSSIVIIAAFRVKPSNINTLMDPNGFVTVNQNIFNAEDASIFSTFSVVPISSTSDLVRLAEIHVGAYGTDPAEPVMVSETEHRNEILDLLNHTSKYCDTTVEAAKLGRPDRTNHEQFVGWIRYFVAQNCEFIMTVRGDTLLEAEIEDTKIQMTKKYCLKEKTHIYITHLAVDPFFRRRGIGSRLVNNITDKADEWGLPC